MIMAQFGEFAIDFFTDIVDNDNLKIKEQYHIGDGIHLTPSGHTILKDKVLEKNLLSATLPLKFTLLQLMQFQQKVIVKWETQNEEANQNFIIEHGTDGRNFAGVGNVSGKNGALNNKYEFTHRPNPGETQYYRIQSINANGSKEYSAVASIKVRTEILPIQIIFIQPQVILYFNEQTSGNAFINIYGVDGKLLQNEQRKVKGQDIIKIKTNNLLPGIYSIKITYNQRNTTGRFVIH
jgi:hypothetical protein